MRKGWLRPFLLQSVLPAALVMVLFVIALFLILIPMTRRAILEQKKTMIRELTTSAWNILARFHYDETSGRLTRAEAQHRAIEQVRNLHYGTQMKDYFWINDMTPRMIIHPYRTDLNGKDLSNHRDPDGKYPFREFVRLVQSYGSGYVEYRWQYEDDPSRIVPKISYVKGFKPWGWILGTGVYMQDVEREMERVNRQLEVVALGIAIVVSLLILIQLRGAYLAERQRQQALHALQVSEERYRILVESAEESILMVTSTHQLFANRRMLSRLDYSDGDFSKLKLEQILATECPEGQAGFQQCKAFLKSDQPATRIETVLRTRDNKQLPVLLSLSHIANAAWSGFVAIATDISKEKEQDLATEQLAADVRLALSQNDGDSLVSAGARILEAPDHDALRRINNRMPVFMSALIESGTHGHLINRYITANADATLERCVQLATEELGAAPVPYSFLVMGSEGRKEQTLCTDQDNAIVFDGDAPACRPYFLQLGSHVSAGLAEAGYRLCDGGIMASNPEWVLSLPEWESKFKTWIHTMEAEDLLQTKIFFDFRSGFGQADLAERLRQTLFAMLDRSPQFFGLLTRNVLLFEPPLSILGSFVLEEEYAGRPALDIKGAMAQLVDFARIYALKHKLSCTNTRRRLQALAEEGVFEPGHAEEMLATYEGLMRIRLEHQAKAVRQKQEPGNRIVPEILSTIDQKVLKQSLAQIKHFQNRLSYDFAGGTG